MLDPKKKEMISASDATYLAIDPNIFSNDGLADLKKLLKLLEWIESKHLIFDEELDTIYQKILNKDAKGEKTLAMAILGKIFAYRDFAKLEPIPSLPEIQTLLAKIENDEIDNTLMRVACIHSDTVVVVEDLRGHRPIHDQVLRQQICTLLGREAILYTSELIKPTPYIMTEGKTDWKHLKAALRNLKKDGRFLGLQIEFEENSQRRGADQLLDICRFGSLREAKLTICIFDRDLPHIISDASDPQRKKSYKYWKNKLYSFPIPVPGHRLDIADCICIEFYYEDSEIIRENLNGKRLFTSNEFEHPSGIHKTDKRFVCQEQDRLYKEGVGHRSIIDTQVFYIHNNEPAVLSKNKFANYILNEDANFDDFDFSEFAKIFDVILDIMDDVLQRSE